MLARLQQSDFKNALASARAVADLAAANNERLHKLLVSNVISKQEVDKSNADRQTADAHHLLYSSARAARQPCARRAAGRGWAAT